MKILECLAYPTLKLCARRWGIADSTFHRHEQSNEQAEMVRFVRHKNKHLKGKEQAHVRGSEREARSRVE